MLVPRWAFDWRCCRQNLSDCNSRRSEVVGKKKPDHLEVVLILEFSGTDSAVVLVVTFVLHMLICCVLTVEFLRAYFTANFGLPMADGCHMLVRCSLGPKCLSASLAPKTLRPMACSVQVLIAGTLSLEFPGASLTFRPVSLVIHVVITVFFVPEGSCTGLALIHLEIVVKNREYRKNRGVVRSCQVDSSWEGAEHPIYAAAT